MLERRTKRSAMHFFNSDPLHFHIIPQHYIAGEGRECADIMGLDKSVPTILAGVSNLNTRDVARGKP